MCVLLTSNKIVTFLRTKRDPAKRVVDFPRERDTFRNKIMEIVEDFDEKSYNNKGEPWKSLRILRVNPNFFIFLFFFIMFLLFLSSSIIFHHLQSSSFIFVHFLSFSFIFLHFLSLFFLFFFFSGVFSFQAVSLKGYDPNVCLIPLCMAWCYIRELVWNWLDTQLRLKVVAAGRDPWLQSGLDFGTAKIQYLLYILKIDEEYHANFEFFASFSEEC